LKVSQLNYLKNNSSFKEQFFKKKSE